MSLPISARNDIVIKENRDESDGLLVSAAKAGDTHGSHRRVKPGIYLIRKQQRATVGVSLYQLMM